MNNPNDILRRKAKAAKEGREAKLMSPSRALRRALTRAAELGLRVKDEGAQHDREIQRALAVLGGS